MCSLLEWVIKIYGLHRKDEFFNIISGHRAAPRAKLQLELDPNLWLGKKSKPVPSPYTFRVRFFGADLFGFIESVGS